MIKSVLIRLSAQAGSQFREVYTGCCIVTGEKPKIVSFTTTKIIMGQAERLTSETYIYRARVFRCMYRIKPIELKGEKMTAANAAEYYLMDKLYGPKYNRILTLRQNANDRLAKIAQTHPFHEPNHTVHDVFVSGVILAKKYGISGEDLFVLCVSLLKHDLGYCEKYWQNEKIGADETARYLRNLNYHKQVSDHGHHIVMATQLPQKPITRLAKIGCDSDFSSLGGYFLSAGLALLKENAIQFKLGNMPKDYKLPENELEWLIMQKTFLETQHPYFTEEAEKLFGEQRKLNSIEINSLITGLKGSPGRTLEQLISLEDWIAPQLPA